MKRAIAIGTIWIVISVVNAGFVNANFRAEFEDLCHSSRWARNHLAFSIGWSLFPLSAVLTPFMTGFYQDGWTLSGAPCERSLLVKGLWK
jgi:hypothetical protein